MSFAGIRKRWAVAQEDRVPTFALADELGVPHLLAHLLMRRGIDGAEAARAFLSPSLDQLSDPHDLPDMGAAVDRVRTACMRGERVLVFGDYDVDGTAGTALLVRALYRLGVIDLQYDLPCRFTDGYGLSPERVQQAADEGVGLIITVDNGVNARTAAETARARGIGFVVTDHHLPEGDLPEADAVVNPKRLDPSSRAYSISGAAVALKLAWALTGEPADMDLAALGTVADIVPLQGENRAIVALGLAQMAHQTRPGLRALAELARLDQGITAEKIAFQVGPRLNAAGRMGDSTKSLELLLTDDPREGRRLAKVLDRLNTERKECERTMFEEAVAGLDAREASQRHAIVLAREGWHPGVLGIVASRLQGACDQPVAMLTVGEDGLARGSIRGSEGFHVVDALAACSDHVLRFGGHAAAGGVTLPVDNLAAFREAFEHAAAAQALERPSAPCLELDGLVSLSQLEPRLIQALDALEPFGAANPAPRFCSFGVEVAPDSIRVLNGGHVQFTARQGAAMHKAICFSMAEWLDPERFLECACRGPVALAYSPRLNTWRGRTEVQLTVDDINLGDGGAV